MLSDKNLSLLKQKGISQTNIENQINLFKSGFPFIKLIRPASIGDGIMHFSKAQQFEFIKQYENGIKRGIHVQKFVPASGAASRMFKDYFEYLNSGNGGNDLPEAILEFDQNKEKFAFWDELHHLLNQKGCEHSLTEIIKLMLLPDGLNYGNSPKGVIAFHKYPDFIKSPVAEHLTEGALYATCNNQTVDIHFTVSPEHLHLFEEEANRLKNYLEHRFNVKYSITFSFQKPSTDTIAVTPNNDPFLMPNGDIVLRPAGHGALIENLNDLDSDIIFIKNIDNVVSEHLVDETVHYKKMLGGILMELQGDIFSALKALEYGNLDQNSFDSIVSNMETKWNLAVFKEIKSLKLVDAIAYLKRELNKPIRVCGMVENEGEPGGGPFWCLHANGKQTLQIVESSQIDSNNIEQQEILNSSTHFNPVDLVIATRNFKGEKFNLPDFVDNNAGFISKKSINGLPLKAMELPGLWNGAMSDWITCFVEVPIVTFNPVKTLNDLLRLSHQPKEEHKN